MRFKLADGRHAEIRRLFDEFATNAGFDAGWSSLRCGGSNLLRGADCQSTEGLSLILRRGGSDPDTPVYKVSLIAGNAQSDGKMVIDVRADAGGLLVLANEQPLAHLISSQAFESVHESGTESPHLILLGPFRVDWKLVQSATRLSIVGDDERIDAVDVMQAIGQRDLDAVDLVGCRSLKSVAAFEGLTMLRSLDLSGCTSLVAVDVLAGMTSLRSLSLNRCESLTSINALARLSSLQSLNLQYCESLITVEALAGLTSLRSLDLSGCTSLVAVDVLAGMTSLRSLRLNRCESLTSIDALAGLTLLQALDLSHCESLITVEALAGLTSLQSLDLSCCGALTSIDALAGLALLQSLDLSLCGALTSIDALADLTLLQSLDLRRCESVTSIEALAGLTALQSLELSCHPSLASIEALAGLTSLQSLSLSGFISLTSIEALAGLTSLRSLNLYKCNSLTSIESLAGLTSLQSLRLWDCVSLVSIEALAGLTALRSLNLCFCTSLTSIEALAGLASLESLTLSSHPSLTSIEALAGLTLLQSLDLSHCGSLTSIEALAGLALLQSLNLSHCESLTSIAALTGLTSLQSLDLSNCKSLTSIEALAGQTSLESVKLEGCPRITSLIALGSCTALNSLDADFHPASVATLLAPVAACRGDAAFIRRKAGIWIAELLSSCRDAPNVAPSLAIALAKALPLAGPEASTPHIAAWIDAVCAADLNAAPLWATLFRSLHRHQGWKTMFTLLDTLPQPPMLEAVGGLCDALSDPALDAEARPRAVDWLHGLDTEDPRWIARALPVAAEICLAHECLGLRGELQRWLRRFTAVDDGGLMDSVHARLAQWALDANDLPRADASAQRIHSAVLRDPLHRRLASRLAASDPARAGALFSAIRSPALQDELARELEAMPAFTAEPLNVARLALVRHGDPLATMDLLERVRAAHPESPAPARLADALNSQAAPADDVLALLLSALGTRLAERRAASRDGSDAGLVEALSSWLNRQGGATAPPYGAR